MEGHHFHSRGNMILVFKWIEEFSSNGVFLFLIDRRRNNNKHDDPQNSLTFVSLALCVVELKIILTPCYLFVNDRENLFE